MKSRILFVMNAQPMMIAIKRRLSEWKFLEILVRDDDEFAGGTIIDPNNGKIYRCKVWLEGNNLKLRGYLGPFFRTQTWLPER
jgi:uncharacterized protein (DUF2147 family)